MLKRLYQLQIIVLLAGTLFAWYTVYNDFVRFYNYEGTIFRIKDCVVPNPVVTPCFYGAFAFLIALIWSIYIYRRKTEVEQVKHEKRLRWLLVASVLFAWSVFGTTVAKFVQSKGEPTTGCSGVVTSSPFATPCFIGAVIFLVALIVCMIIISRHRIIAQQS